MAITVSAGFDSGNIDVVRCVGPHDIGEGKHAEAGIICSDKHSGLSPGA